MDFPGPSARLGLAEKDVETLSFTGDDGPTPLKEAVLLCFDDVI